jgi:hypothetical protein
LFALFVNCGCEKILSANFCGDYIVLNLRVLQSRKHPKHYLFNQLITFNGMPVNCGGAVDDTTATCVNVLVSALAASARKNSQQFFNPFNTV